MRFVGLLAVVVGCGPRYVKLEPARVRKLDVALVGGGNALCPKAGEPQLRALVTHLDDRTAKVAAMAAMAARAETAATAATAAS
jgi:hypothetical protein